MTTVVVPGVPSSSSPPRSEKGNAKQKSHKFCNLHLAAPCHCPMPLPHAPVHIFPSCNSENKTTLKAILKQTIKGE